MNGNWNDPTQWSTGVVPRTIDDVTIGHTSGFSLIVTIPTGISASVKTLTITGGTSLTTTITLAGTRR